MIKPFPPCYSQQSVSVSIIFLIFTVIFFTYPKGSNAANLVSGKYLSASGKTIVLSLSIQTPSPANLIVEQYLSPNNNIVGTSPQAKKIDKAQSNAKWLFRNIQSGSITLSIQLKEPINGSVSAMIRYRDPNSGAFTELRIQP